MTALPRSNVRPFVAGFLSAMMLSGVAMAFPGMRASLSESPTRTFNADQMIYFYPEWMAMYDLNDNGIPDPFEKGIRTDTNAAVSLMFVSLDGDNIPDFCQLSDSNAALCGTSGSESGVDSLYRMVPEICDNGIDDESDTRTDCEDSQCANHPSCMQQDTSASDVSAAEICDNDADDDADSIYDCWDSDCTADPACTPAVPAVYQIRPDAPNVIRDAFGNAVKFPTTNENGASQRALPVVPTVAPVITAPIVVPATPTNLPTVAPVITVPTAVSSSSTGLPYPPSQYIDPAPSSAPIDMYQVIPTTGQVYSFSVCPNTRADNDGDGVQNALDPACYISTTTSTSATSSMHGAADELCGNSRDDDGDSYTDMNDPDCMCSRGQNENG